MTVSLFELWKTTKSYLLLSKQILNHPYITNKQSNKFILHMYKLVYNKLQRSELKWILIKNDAYDADAFIFFYIRSLRIDLFDLDSVLYAKLDFNILDNTKTHAVNRIHYLIKMFAD